MKLKGHEQVRKAQSNSGDEERLGETTMNWPTGLQTAALFLPLQVTGSETADSTQSCVDCEEVDPMAQGPRTPALLGENLT